MVIIMRHKILGACLGSSYASLVYKPDYQLYELHKMNQSIILATSLILGGAGFVYSAIPNTLPKTALHSVKSHKTASRLPKL